MTIDLFFKKYDLIREIIWAMFMGKAAVREKRVDALMLMLQMNVYYLGIGKRPPFASARWYASNSRCSEKTVDRLVGWLKEMGFARVKRLRRRDTESAWEQQNREGRDNSAWRELAQEYGPGGPFKVYPAGFYSTNELDLRPLIAQLCTLLGQALQEWLSWWRVYKVEGGVLFKTALPAKAKRGQWYRPPSWPVETFLPLAPG